MTEIRTAENNQSSCFICTKYLYQRGQGGESCSGVLSIRAIFRHLKINHEEEVPTSNSDRVMHYLDQLVPFCNRCYPTFAKLTKYCADFEILQMRIHYFLNQLNKLIVVEDTGPSFCITDEARKKLKNKLVETCTLERQTGPYVNLRQLDKERIGTIADQTSKSNSEKSSDVEYEPQEEDEMSNDSQYDNNDVDYEPDTSKPSKNKLSQPKRSRGRPRSQKGEINKTKASSSIKNVPCLDCDCYFEMKSRLFEHTLRIHPERIFPQNSKPENLTVPQHKMYLTHLLNTEVDSCGSWISGFNCTYCEFNTKNTTSVRNHLFKEHKDKLVNNLVQMQINISQNEISKIVKMPSAPIQNQHRPAKERDIVLNQFCKTKNKMKPEYTCSICKIRTTSLRTHEALHHPETFLLSKRSKKVSLELFKMYCVEIINKQAKKFTKSRQDNKVRYHCIHCQNSYVDLQGCRMHLVLTHADNLSVQLEKLQEALQRKEVNLKSKTKCVRPIIKAVVTDSEICKICDVRLTQRGMTMHMRKTHPDEYVKSYKYEDCLICKKMFRSKWWLDFHVICCHADKVFEEWKATTVGVEQFKSYCDYMIDTEVKGLKQVNRTDENVRYKCSYCSITFCDTKYTQIHFVMQHKEILGNKLKEMLESKTVVEIEQYVVIKREDIGEEIGDDGGDFEATEVFCGKSVTKQEASESWGEDDDEMVDLEDANENDVRQQEIEIDTKQEDCKMDIEAILPN